MSLNKIKSAMVGLLAAGIVAAAAVVPAQQPAPVAVPVAPSAKAVPKVVEAGITYDMRFIEMAGLAWRGELHKRLKPIARKGPYTVWVVDEGTLREVLKRGKAIQAPRLTAFPNAKATVTNQTRRSIVTSFKEGGAPENLNPAPSELKVEFKDAVVDPESVRDRPAIPKNLPAPITELEQSKTLKLPNVDVQEIPEGIQAHLSGHRVVGGVLVRAEIESSLIVSLRGNPVPERVTIEDEIVERSLFVQVPEIIQSRFEGEWLVPADSTLIVGLGIHQFPKEGSPTEIREQLVAFKATEANLSLPPSSGSGLSPVVPSDR